MATPLNALATLLGTLRLAICDTERAQRVFHGTPQEREDLESRHFYFTRFIDTLCSDYEMSHDAADTLERFAKEVSERNATIKRILHPNFAKRPWQGQTPSLAHGYEVEREVLELFHLKPFPMMHLA